MSVGLRPARMGSGELCSGSTALTMSGDALRLDPAPRRMPVTPAVSARTGPIVVVSLEGDARYHLRALGAELADQVLHLMPMPPTDGRTDIAWTTDLSVLDDASVCVITGGIDAWTGSVGLYADRLGVPLVFSEVAVGIPEPPSRVSLPFVAVTTSTPLDRERLATHVRCAPTDVTVVGTPALDGVESNVGEAGRILVITSVSDEISDRGLLLNQVRRLKGAGYEVVVRPHPREPRAQWAAEFTIDAAASALAEAVRAEVVVGHPSTAMAWCAATGVPLVVVVPDTIADDPTFGDLIAVAGTAIGPGGDVIEAVSGARPSARSRVEGLVGPIGGAATRLAGVWHDAARGAKRVPVVRADLARGGPGG